MVQFKRGKDKKKRKPRMDRLRAGLGSAKKTLASKARKLANKATEAVGNVAEKVEKNTQKRFGRTLGKNLKSAGQYLGGEIQQGIAKIPDSNLSKKDRASLYVRGTKNKAIGTTKLIPAAVNIRANIAARKVKYKSRKTKF
jgi:hypothetical protein